MGLQRLGMGLVRFFPGFESFRMETTEATIVGVVGGSGPPLLLLHGWPQSHIEWRKIAPVLAEQFTVVATDLRGYGDSSKPPAGENHVGYSKRSTARDQIEVMRQLGFDRFQVVGHDRGGRVGHRMALDHPEIVSKLVVIDIVPTLKIYSNITRDLAAVYSHWFLMLESPPLPETLFINSADFYLRNKWFRGLIPDSISEDVFAEYLRHFKDPATMHAMCEDYRAAGTVDLDHDQADLSAKIRCPLLAIWGATGAMERLYDVRATWLERAVDVKGTSLPGGHWLPEELPDDVCRELMVFLK